MFTKILIANRGEIACRIMMTAQSMGIECVAVYSDADKNARHVRLADEAMHIGPAASAESYLRGDVIIRAALETGAQAIHPGYGFLSENESFAAACAAAGIVFIGPSAAAIESMGLKDRAKAIMTKAGVPVVPGYLGADQSPGTLRTEAGKIGYPVLIKAVAGGGGKGMRLVESAGDFDDALTSCKREALSSFGNDHVMVEKYIQKPRHVEVQVLADQHGHAVYLFERDCSLQRRHQKVVEEAPAPNLPDKTRKKLGEAAVKAVKAIGYYNAGTIEFIMDSKTHEFYFMEMNTRLQVEHPVTEMITDLDLVELQLRVAAGEKLPFTQRDLSISGHAFEVRLYAEDPGSGFLPQTGRINVFVQPDARVDTGVEDGDDISMHYDPMIAKIIVHGETRDEAVSMMREALGETVLDGVVTNQEFLGNIFVHPAFAAGDVDTGFIARHEGDLIPADYGMATDDDLRLVTSILNNGDVEQQVSSGDIWSDASHWRMNGRFSTTATYINRGQTRAVTMDATPYTPVTQDFTIVDTDQGATLFRDGKVIHLTLPGRGGRTDQAGQGRVIAPMPGKIVSVMVKNGDVVTRDQPLLVMEAMKMEMTIRAACAGVVVELPVESGSQVRDGALLVDIKPEAKP